MMHKNTKISSENEAKLVFGEIIKLHLKKMATCDPLDTKQDEMLAVMTCRPADNLLEKSVHEAA